MEVTMAPGILGRIDIVIFSLFGLYLLISVSILAVVRFRYPAAWEKSRSDKRFGFLSSIREAVRSDPRAGSSTPIEVGLMISDLLLYPVGILLVGRILWATIRELL